jgi:cytochrome b561
MLRNGPHGWGSVAKTLHWLVAAAILVQAPLGIAAKSWRVSPLKLDLFVLHKSLGLTILALVVARLAWRLSDASPALPAAMPDWERRAARATHAMLYALLLAVPLSGWIASAASNVPFRFFWQFPLPAIVAPDETLAELAKRSHFALLVAFAALVALHAGAALRHHFVRRDDVLRRMLPSRREAQ